MADSVDTIYTICINTVKQRTNLKFIEELGISLSVESEGISGRSVENDIFVISESLSSY